MTWSQNVTICAMTYSAFPAISLGFTITGKIFAPVTVFQSNHSGSHIPSLWMVHAGCVFVAGIHPSRTRMSGSFDPVQRHASAQRLDFGLYSHSREFWGNGVRTHVNSKGKIPSTRGSEEGQTCNSASCRTVSPTNYWLSNSNPCND